MAFVKQIQGQLQVEDGAIAACGQVTAELAEEQRVGGGACGRGDVGRDLGAAVHPVMDVVAEVSSQVAAVGEDVQRDAGEREQGGYFLQEREWGKKSSNYSIQLIMFLYFISYAYLWVCIIILHNL